MALSRRALFQKTGAVVAALGLSELAINLGVPNQANAYAQSLSQPFSKSSGRKLALLIGIDIYPGSVFPADHQGQAKLQGAATDVALQKELLIHRFGFLPADIVCLTNERATRAGIYEAFVEHLYNQAKPGDRVVVHFSGYGSKVRYTDEAGRLNSGNVRSEDAAAMRSLVPNNGFFPKSEDQIVEDILEIELKSLLKQLKTNQITTIIDAGFVDIPTQLSGGLRSRTRATVAVGQAPSSFPLLANKRLEKEYDPFPGVLLRGANLEDAVMERPWDGFSAGAFTYVLTQYLWSAPKPATVEQALGRSQETLLRWGGSNQQPDGEGGSVKPDKNSPMYHTPLLEGTRGSGAITALSGDGKKATLWLGGLPPRVLKYLEAQSAMTCNGRLLRIQSHDRLTAQARLVDESKTDSEKAAPLQVGQSVMESVRVLPNNISLIVALDSRLERIERVDATSALSALAFAKSTSGTDLPADCLLSKPMRPSPELLDAAKNLTAVVQNAAEIENKVEISDQLGYGLFSLTRSPIPGTLAQQDEAINPAISRLEPKLKALLALKMLRLTENRASSGLSVRVVLEMVAPEEKSLITRQTIQMGDAGSTKGFDEASEVRLTPEVPIGARVRYRLFNEGDRPLYYTLVIVNPRERLSAFCPSIEQDTDGAEISDDEMASSAIAPGSSVAVPNPGLDWAIDSAAGPIETYVVCSTQPLKRTFDKLLITDPGGSGQRISPLPEPLEVIEALLTDIGQQDSTDEYRLNTSDWATLNFTYRAV